MLCHAINASHHCQVCLIGCSGLQHQCSLQYHTADSVLTSGCSFIRQHIWIKISVVVAILGRCIKGKRFSTGKRWMWKCISGQQIEDIETLSTRSIIGWGGWCSGQRWHRLWSRLWIRLWSLLSASVGRRYTYSFASPAYLRISCSAILARKAFGHVDLTKCSRVSLYRSLQHFIPRKLNTPLLLFSDVGARFLD